MKHLYLILFLPFLFSCGEDVVPGPNPDQQAILTTFNGEIDLTQLFNYANQSTPEYISRDNTLQNAVTDEGATLGRVLFYDRNLSIDNTISCGSCHFQTHGFGDSAQASIGVNGSTARHAMRLVNSRFSFERSYFWDKRANSLEEQSSQPIQDHVEMGYSGLEGNPDISGLLEKLSALDYYSELFAFVYGDIEITEERLQIALAQFVRSIQSFDSKFDEGMVKVQESSDPFPNFTEKENLGKELFLTQAEFNFSGERISGGLSCGRCHNSPEFNINSVSRNNGVIETIEGTESDFIVFKSPSIRDVFRADGGSNGPFMHTGDFDMNEVIEHYNEIPSAFILNLDFKLRPFGNPQRLMMTDEEKEALLAFMHTLSGTAVYNDPRWSDPFIR